jgi:predicted transcriptional regulator
MEEDFYSLANAASFLGVSESSVNKWIKKHNIEKKIIITDKKRLYISRANLLMLADLYGRKAAKRVPADITIKREDGDFQEEAEKRLYSVAEVALFLNASEASVKRWIRVHNIEKKVTSANRRRVHISYKDMLMLADVQQRNVTPNILPINVVEELKELRSKLKDLASDIEDIKHDFRVYVERSIYIG